jgi:hypothetical protein
MEAEPSSRVSMPLDIEAVAAYPVQASERSVELFAPSSLWTSAVTSWERHQRRPFRRSTRTITQGFMIRPNRINVALSRAMDRLIIVGARTRWPVAGPMHRVAQAFERELSLNSARLVDVSRLDEWSGSLPPSRPQGPRGGKPFTPTYDLPSELLSQAFHNTHPEPHPRPCSERLRQPGCARAGRPLAEASVAIITQRASFCASWRIGCHGPLTPRALPCDVII